MAPSSTVATQPPRLKADGFTDGAASERLCGSGRWLGVGKSGRFAFAWYDVLRILLALLLLVSAGRFNVDMEAEVFELPFAAGTVVYDAIKKKDFVQTASGDRDYVAYQRHVRDRARDLAAARGAESRQPFRWRTVLLVVHSLVFASIGVC